MSKAAKKNVSQPQRAARAKTVGKLSKRMQEQLEAAAKAEKRRLYNLAWRQRRREAALAAGAPKRGPGRPKKAAQQPAQVVMPATQLVLVKSGDNTATAGNTRSDALATLRFLIHQNSARLAGLTGADRARVEGVVEALRLAHGVLDSVSDD